MKERPILFSAPMVRAILAGTKTQTRRVIKPQPELSESAGLCWRGVAYGITTDRQPYVREFLKRCPYGVPGDRLWVKETHVYRDKYEQVYYRADHPVHDPYAHNGWRPSIFMPRKWSRVSLEVSGVRVERLHSISETDAQAEGVERDTAPCDHTRLSCEEIGCMGPTYRSTFAELWHDINGSESWDANPWVWVVEFKRIDAAERAA